jgi:prepilin-type N-terminal cleavage/methylation domain-containing protein
MTGARRKPYGFTLVELMVVILIIALLIAILLPALARARSYARMAACASNMRQFGIGITNYAIEQDDKMLPADRNYWHYLANYRGESTKGNDGSDVFRCGVDPFKSDAPGAALTTVDVPAPTDNYALSNSGVNEAYSYAANYAGRVHLSNVVLHASNDLGTPFSYAETGRIRRLGGTAPDTILFIESWGECVGDLNDFDSGNTINVGFEDGVVNRIMLRVANPQNLRGGVLADPYWRMRPAIQDYDDMANALTVSSVKRTFDKTLGNNMTCAHHWLMTMIETQESYDSAYHVGAINVLNSDGSVGQQDVIKLGTTPIGGDGRWTRGRD